MQLHDPILYSEWHNSHVTCPLSTCDLGGSSVSLPASTAPAFLHSAPQRCCCPPGLLPHSLQVGQFTARRGSMVMAFLGGTITADARWPHGAAGSGGQQDNVAVDPGGSSSSSSSGGGGCGGLAPECFNPDRWLEPGAKQAGGWGAHSALLLGLPAVKSESARVCQQAGLDGCMMHAWSQQWAAGRAADSAAESAQQLWLQRRVRVHHHHHHHPSIHSFCTTHP
jgi:hypothetical protein